MKYTTSQPENIFKLFTSETVQRLFVAILLQLGCQLAIPVINKILMLAEETKNSCQF